jgi:hypothetical protein
MSNAKSLAFAPQGGTPRRQANVKRIKVSNLKTHLVEALEFELDLTFDI